MSWIAEYDTQGREFPSCVHVTKTTHMMTHGATYVPIEDGKAVRDENAKLRELVSDMWPSVKGDVRGMRMSAREFQKLRNRVLEFGIEVE